jgi:hypothetical protein
MIALREGATKLNHEHFHSGIAEGAFHSSFLTGIRGPRIYLLLFFVYVVQAKKKNDLMYFA